MSIRSVALVTVVLALAACGSSHEKRAVEACQKAVKEKLGGKAYDVDAKDMLAKAKAGTDNVVALSSTVVFDKGLPSESKQTFECRVEFDPKNPKAEPAVIGMTFQW